MRVYYVFCRLGAAYFSTVPLKRYQNHANARFTYCEPDSDIVPFDVGTEDTKHRYDKDVI